MAKKDVFGVLVATDGSFTAQAAIGAAIEFPWPTPSRVRAVIGLRTITRGGELARTRAALEKMYDGSASAARRALARRWPGAEAVTVDKRPVDAILSEAKRFDAGAIVVGWRGYGGWRRLLMGSVSHAVVRCARCPVLVVQRHGRKIRHIVLGLDGSRNSKRGVAFLATLEPPRNGRVTLVTVVEPTRLSSTGRMSARIRATLEDNLRTARRSAAFGTLVRGRRGAGPCADSGRKGNRRSGETPSRKRGRGCS
jgi:nucleotide-binding universal stress UspA family protein